MNTDTLLQTLTNGVLLGLIYTAVALGLSLTLGVLRIVNMAHSALLIFASLVTWQLVNGFGMNVVAALLLVVPGSFVVGGMLEAWLLRPIRRQPESTGLLLLFGLLIVIEALALATWTTDPRTVRMEGLNHPIHLGPITITTNRLLAAGLGAVSAVALHAFLSYTMLGRATRAMSDNPDAAAVLGVDTGRLSTLVFAIGVALAGLAGVLVAMTFTFSPQEHVRWLAWAFLIVIVGGLGSVGATVAAGLAIGITEAFVGMMLPFQYVHLVIYGLLAIALVARGGGLMARAERRI